METPHKEYMRQKIYATMSHTEYQHSDRWRYEVRPWALDAAGHMCEHCGVREEDMKQCYLEVHHKTYETQGIETLDDLTVLCQPCHTELHRHML